MAAKRPLGGKKSVGAKKFFTVAEANAVLPLARAVLRDITELAQNLREHYGRLSDEKGRLGEAHQEELQQAIERDQDRLREYVEELQKLGIELKDYHTGLIDFRSRMDGREVYLCWKLGEPEVAHWHELEAGFAGRQRIMAGTASGG
jgi:hypothetical protein